MAMITRFVTGVGNMRGGSGRETVEDPQHPFHRATISDGLCPTVYRSLPLCEVRVRTDRTARSGNHMANPIAPPQTV